MADLWVYSLELETTFTLAEKDPIGVDSYEPAVLDLQAATDTEDLDSYAPSSMDLAQASDPDDLDSYEPAAIDLEGVHE